VGADPIGVAFGPTGVLVANFAEGNISRVDPASNSVLSAIPLTLTGVEGPVVLAFGEGGIWVTMAAFDPTTFDAIAGSVERLDPVSGQVVANIPVGKSPQAIATSPGAIWVANYLDGTVSRIDPTTNTLVATITVDGEPNGIAFGSGAVWVTSEKTGNVSRIDPATNAVVATIQTLGTSEGVVSGAGAIWVAYYGHPGQTDGALSRIDPTTNQVVRTIVLGHNPVEVAFGGTSVWVAMRGEPTVVQVNPTTNTIQARVTIGAPIVDPTSKLLVGLEGIVADDHNVWAVQPLPAPDATSDVPPGKVIRITY
jgi:YVTN family beta-propeller protein